MTREGPINLHKQMRMGGKPEVGKKVKEYTTITSGAKKLKNFEHGAPAYEPGTKKSGMPKASHGQKGHGN